MYNHLTLFLDETKRSRKSLSVHQTDELHGFHPLLSVCLDPIAPRNKGVRAQPAQFRTLLTNCEQVFTNCTLHSLHTIFHSFCNSLYSHPSFGTHLAIGTHFKNIKTCKENKPDPQNRIKVIISATKNVPSYS